MTPDDEHTEGEIAIALTERAFDEVLNSDDGDEDETDDE